MDPSLETVKWKLPEGTTESEWDDAYRRVDAYLSALRIDNTLQRSALIHRILKGAVVRIDSGACDRAAAATLEECESLVCNWFREALDLPSDTPPTHILERGYLALLLFETGSGWRQFFLQPAPWPPAFIQNLRAHYFEAGPEFQHSQMGERPIDYGPWSDLADQALRELDKRPILRRVGLAAFVISLIAILYYFTR
tara:strand:+ start:12578 stop:13168 length:591 start_codon:yes stop_codon:yes gene_type:complete